MTVCIDQDVIIRQLTAKIERTSNPRVRAMLERVREHAQAEARGDLQGLMNTLTPDPAYHFWMPEGDTGPKGRDGVASFYAGYVAARLHFLEVNCERIVADEDCVVLEAVLKCIFPGPVLAADPTVDADIDPARHYLLTTRNVTFWPFDENLLIVGEDSYSGTTKHVRVLEDHELPEGYKALFADSSAS